MQRTEKFWAVNLPNGDKFQIRDLAPQLVAEIARANDVSWVAVIDAPLANIGVAVDVLRAVSIAADATFPELLTTRAWIAACDELFDLVDDVESTMDSEPFISYTAP